MPRQATHTGPHLPKGVTLLPSGRFRARLTFEGTAHSAVLDSAKQAAIWIRRTRGELEAGTHASQIAPATEVPSSKVPTFAEHAERWLAGHSLRPRTRQAYRSILDRLLLPAFGPITLDAITVTMVKEWHTILCPDAPAMRARTYSVLNAIMGAAYSDDVISSNPCRVKGGGKAERRSRTEVPTVTQVQQLADAMPSAKHKVMVLVSAWCGLRFGEATELRAKDIVHGGPEGLPVAIRVRRAVARAQGRYIIGPPKTDAGIRDVAIPPHVRQAIGDYLASLPDDPEHLVFPSDSDPSRHMANGGRHRDAWTCAREAVGLPDLRWHDLRHFSATMAALGGATVAELQARIGHSTPSMAMHYQHAARGRDEQVAVAMSALANVVPLKPRPAPEPEPKLEDDLRPVWMRLRTGGSWHLGGDAGKAYCGMRLHGDVEVTHGDQPAGRLCRACAQRKARGA